MELTYNQLVYDSLPEGFIQTGEFNLKKNTRMMILLNIAGFILLIAAIGILQSYTLMVRQGYGGTVLSFEVNSLTQVGLFILYMVIDFILLVILHEGIHGICFWLFTRRRPVFALGPGYAYAAAPDVFIRKNPYLITATSPLILLTLLGMVLIPFVSDNLLFHVSFITIMNIAGAVGDLWVFGGLLFKREPVLICDSGDCVAVFQPVKQ